MSERSKLACDALDVGRSPVNPAALGTTGECGLCFEDVFGHFPAERRLVDRRQQRIAARAARQGVGAGIEIEGLNNLAQLSTEVVRLHVEMRRERAPAQQPAVASEQDALLGPSPADQGGFAPRRVVHRIGPQQPQPSGQASERRIGKELRHGGNHQPMSG